MKQKKRAFFHSVVALVLCICMLTGTTFAWFTDEVTSANNIIKSGTLDVTLEWKDTAEGTWQDASEATIFDYELWEPGYTQVKYVKVANVGNLAFQFRLDVVPNGASSGEAKLEDVIDVYLFDSGVTPTREMIAGATPAGTLAQLMGNADGAAEGYMLPGEAEEYCLVLKMQESAGNEYQNLSVGGGFRVVLKATQYTYEEDTYDDQYDVNAKADFFPGFQGGSAGVAVESDDNGVTTEEAAMDGGDVSAVIPAGVQVADGVNSLALSVTMKDASEANIQLNENEEMRPLDVHIEGVAEGNTVPMLITLKSYLTTGINTGALKLYHVENGVAVAMTQVDVPANHNEFSYDPATGDVTLALASFSEVAVVADTNNTWNGTAANAFAGGTGTEADPYIIANADQLAYFRNQVDGGNTFEGKYVQLYSNIYLSNVNFDPIGWGYENAEWNRDAAAGKVFKGTFDGNYKIIFDLYQSGWDLEADNGTDYTYTNCGFGLFAAAADATFKNLTIYGADIQTECVEMGILVGLSQGNCTYDNIKIHNSKIANYQRPTGGLIGEVSPLNGGGETKITNVEIGSDVVVGSLWGDFDAPCGGVIGARWDDTNTTTVVMKDVTVGCRMDVYSDVTAAYQWYAYRRAGMLIGNTDIPAADGRNAKQAEAPFLTCENVKVYYGDWAAYHYCLFTNDNNPGKNYPWVRVEAGENNPAYSNPRYGHPTDANGKQVVDDNHVCNEHNMELRFNQLYGGGQGVYGQPAHDGVEVINYRYSITYLNDYEVLSIKYVTDNSVAVTTQNPAAQDLVEEWAKVNIGEGKFAFGGWMNAGSTKLTEIAANNTEDIVLYPYFNNPYTARFVDQQGNVIAYCFFHAEDVTKLDETADTAKKQLPNPGTDFAFDYWEVNANGTKVAYNKDNFVNYGYDVTIYPVYRYTGNLKLTPVDEDSDGAIDYYKVEAVGVLDETTVIPGYVNGVPVKIVEKIYENDGNTDYSSGVVTVIVQEGVERLEHNSISHTSELVRVELPNSLKYLGKNVFSRNNWISGIVGGETDKKVLSIEYNGTGSEWDALISASDDEWDNGLEAGSVVTCKDGTYTLTEGRWGTLSWTWKAK